MRVSGFTFVRNAVRLEFPVVECIRSVLPMVDEFVVAVGHSDDGTEELIRSIGDERVVIVPTRWNPNVRTGGYVLAQQTNVALFSCTGQWAIYIQADEAIHEDDHAHLRSLMGKYLDDDRVESLSLHRTNFVGDYRTICRPADDLCVRIVKPHRFVLSRGDAAGFTVHPKYKERGRRITTVDTGVKLFHYLDVRSPTAIAQKDKARGALWQEGNVEERGSLEAYYSSAFARRFLYRYTGTQPGPLRERAQSHGFAFDIDSPLVRKALTRRERRLVLTDFLDRRVSRAFRIGANSSKLVATEPPPDRS
jgi:glycosyltransferase involved in cell wall biosynthesis